MQSRDLVETHRQVSFRQALRPSGADRQGGSRTIPPPPPLAKVAKYGKRARVNMKLNALLVIVRGR